MKLSRYVLPMAIGLMTSPAYADWKSSDEEPAVEPAAEPAPMSRDAELLSPGLYEVAEGGVVTQVRRETVKVIPACGTVAMGEAYADTYQTHKCLETSVAESMGLGEGKSYSAYSGNACPGDQLCYDLLSTVVVEAPVEAAAEPVAEESAGPIVSADASVPVVSHAPEPVVEEDVVVKEPREAPAYDSSELSLGAYATAMTQKGGAWTGAGVALGYDTGAVKFGLRVGKVNDSEDRNTLETEVIETQTDTASGVGYLLETDTRTFDTAYGANNWQAGVSARVDVSETRLNNSTNLTIGPIVGLDALIGNATYTENWEETKAFYVNQEMVQEDSVTHDPIIEGSNPTALMPYIGVGAELGYGKNLGLEGSLQVGKVMSVGNGLPADSGIETGINLGLNYRF